jgi:RHS repeat-associated protein
VTDFGFTSQRREGFGLYDYQARYYSPLLGHFVSPDSIVPDPTNPIELNRYAYTAGNPLKYTDPSGHCFSGAVVDTAACIAAAKIIVDVVTVAVAVYFITENTKEATEILETIPGQGPDLPTHTGHPREYPEQLTNRPEVKLPVPPVPYIETFPAPAEQPTTWGLDFPLLQPDEQFPHILTANPDGRLGGPAHRQEVGRITGEIEQRGLEARQEYHVPTPNGRKTRRFVDVAGIDPETGQPVEFHQVGKQTIRSPQRPIARERYAIDDIEEATGIRSDFHPYN